MNELEPKKYPKRTLQQNKANMCYTVVMKEVWSTIKGFSNYQVSSLGNVRSKDRLVTWSHHGKSGLSKKTGKLLKKIPRKMSENLTYLQVSITENSKQRTVHVHRLVAEAFIPNPYKKPQVNHIDGNGTNNTVTNLEWVTVSENGQHAYKVLGRKAWHKGNTGEKTPTSKPILQISKNGEIVKRWSCGLDAVREGGFESSCISRCVKGINKYHKGYRWEYAT